MTSFADAVARAKQIAAKIAAGANPDTGTKRPFEGAVSDQPEAKKPATDEITAQLRSLADQQRASQAAALAAAAASQINAKLGISGGAVSSGSSSGIPLVSHPVHSVPVAPGLADPHEIARMLGFQVAMTEQTTVPDKMVGYLIGKGGEQITAIQSESKCVVQFVTESNGTPERPCYLTGTPVTIAKAKEVLNRLINNFRAGGTSAVVGNDGAHHLEMMVPGNKVGLIIGKSGETIKGLMESTGTRIIVIQENNSITNHDKPVRISGDKDKCQKAKEKIMELIGDVSSSLAVNSYGTPIIGSDGKLHIEVPIQRSMVGLVIGKGGDMIKKITEESGSRVQFKGDDDGISPTRMLSVDGSEETNKIAMKMISNLIDSAMKQNALTGGVKGPYGQDWSANAGTNYSLSVPVEKCGIIIGKGGETIRDINRVSGAFVELDRAAINPSSNERVFKVVGTQEQVMQAVRLVCEKAQLPNPMVTGTDPTGYGAVFNAAFMGGMFGPRPPFNHPGMAGMMGMGQWNPYSQYGSDQTSSSTTTPSTTTAAGSKAGAQQPQDVAAAWAAYYAQYYSQAMMGGYPASSASSEGSTSISASTSAPAAPPATDTSTTDSHAVSATNGTDSGNQPDYSAAWVEYYKSQGMHQEAAAILQMQQQQQQSSQPQPPQPPPN